MRVCHYGRAPVTELWNKYQLPNNGYKPDAFWVSDDSEENWYNWCIENEFGVLEHRTNLEMDTSELCNITCGQELEAFYEKYKDPDFRFKMIAWNRVAMNYKGVSIFPHLAEFRLRHFWYSGWDCASAAIWDVSCLTILEKT